MKVNTLILITIFSFILLASNNANANIPSSNTLVLDILGKRLQKGVNYYILPVIRGRGGGLTLADPRNKTCPLDVVQEHFEASRGLAVTLSPAKTDTTQRGRAIGLSTDLNIKFSASTACVQSTVLKLDSFDEALGQWFVTTGGVEGNPGPNTISNWFKIDKYNETKDYKLVFCPTVCSFCKVVCKDVGVFVKGGTRRLALTDNNNPFVVMFKRA